MAAYNHFGVNIRTGKMGFKMTRENYAVIDKKCTTHDDRVDYYSVFWGESRRNEFLEIFEDESATHYADAWCEKHKNRALD